MWEVLWSIGARCRWNVRSLPGTPDIAHKARRKTASCMAASGIGLDQDSLEGVSGWLGLDVANRPVVRVEQVVDETGLVLRADRLISEAPRWSESSGEGC